VLPLFETCRLGTLTLFTWACWLGGAALVVGILYGIRQRVRRRIKHLLGHRWFSTLFIPVIAVLPPVLVAATDEQKNYWPSAIWSPLREFLRTHRPLATLALFWPVGVLLLAYGGGWIRKRFIDLDELTAKEYGLILRSLDEVAGNKMGRFASLAADTFSATASVDPKAIFQTITQPGTQISSLLNGIYLVFRLDAEAAEPHSPATICVTLARLHKGQFVDFEAWVPQHQPPTSKAQLLKNRESAIFYCATQRKPLIISDVSKELKKRTGRRFAQGAPGSPEEGSIIAYPVIHQATNSVPYVITVRSHTRNHFTPRLKERYRILLQPFALRISIEHSLAVLKEYHATHSE
jgi:hypothetical protein